MRRLVAITASTAFMVPLVLALPVYAAPVPAPTPVPADVESVELGSVTAPAPEADVQQGTTDPVAAETLQEATAPVLAVSERDTQPFSALGVTWAYDPAVTGTVVQVRVADEDGDWGSWTELVTETADGASGSPSVTQRGGTDLLWTGSSTGVEVELLTRSGAAPTDVAVDLIDPGSSRADSSPGTPAAVQDQAGAAMDMPPIFSRAQWGADETIMKWTPEYAPTLKAATIHHTAESNNYTADQVPGIMRSMYQYHAVSRGWGDIGYNVVVDKFGRAWEGRSGGLTSTVIGAHSGGWNTGTFGVSMMGNYESTTPPAAMLDMVARVIAWKFTLYGIDPRATTRMTGGCSGCTSRYAAGSTITLPTIFAHRDVGATACPGAVGYSKMGDIRARVAAYVDNAPSVRWWELRDGSSAGPAPYQVRYGVPDAVTLACNVNGDGRDDLLTYRNGQWEVRTSVSSGSATATFPYGGMPGARPVCGDWDGDGRAGIGVWDPATGRWWLRNTATAGNPDAGTIQYGWSGAEPVTGDWDGNGTETIGVYERSTGRWMVRNSLSGGAPDRTVQYGWSGAVPAHGDWNGDGRMDLGVYSAGRWWVRDSFTPGAANREFTYGLPTDQPLVGNWDGPGGDGIGVTRPAR
ncbi:N-acetylmuramoyl-L-alanine amidase [Geodermatophilus nigrescens]